MNITDYLFGVLDEWTNFYSELSDSDSDSANSSADSSADYSDSERASERTPLLKSNKGLKVSRGVQTDEHKSLQVIQEYINIAQENEPRTSYFKHLSFVKQSYLDHFRDAIYYSSVSFRASFYFFIHALYPDFFIHSGSNAVISLATTIKNKYFKVLEKMPG